MREGKKTGGFRVTVLLLVMALVFGLVTPAALTVAKTKESQKTSQVKKDDKSDVSVEQAIANALAYKKGLAEGTIRPVGSVRKGLPSLPSGDPPTTGTPTEPPTTGTPSGTPTEPPTTGTPSGTPSEPPTTGTPTEPPSTYSPAPTGTPAPVYCTITYTIGANSYAKPPVKGEVITGEEAGGNPDSVLSGTEVNLKIPKKDGFYFDGWYTRDSYNADVKVTKLNVATNTKIYGRWIETSITYELDGGENDPSNPSTYKYGKGVTSFAPATKVGYAFGGWYLDPEFRTSVTKINTDFRGPVTLYAKFTPETYNIKYKLAGGENDPDNPSEYTYGVGATIHPIKRNGYIFDGWYPDKEYLNPVTEISPTQTGDITLYAFFMDNEEDDVAGSTFGKLFAETKDVKLTSVTIKWEKMDDADGYYIYGSKCSTKEKKYKYKFYKGTKNQKIIIGGLKKDNYYKYYVVAYKIVEGQDVILAKSKTIHFTPSSSEYGLADAIKVSGKSIMLHKGATCQIEAKQVNNRGKKIKNHRSLRYEPTDTSIVKISASGKVGGLKRGKCKIYVYAQNGVYTTLDVTVK